jgi:hypothetical protein
MNISECKVGQQVYFGRSNGEKTLGEIVKVNRTKCKVKQLESRGTMRSYPVGTIWTVPPTLMSPVSGTVAPTVSTPKRTEADIMRDISDAYCGLSPENLTCDGERRGAEVQRVAARLRRQLRDCFTELGRTVSEDEAWRYVEKLPQESFSDVLARRKAEGEAKAAAEKAQNPATAKRLGLPEDIVGRSFKVRQTTFTVTGFKTENFKYPVLATTQTGKRYKLDVPFVLRGLGLAVPAAPAAPATTFNGSLNDLVGRTFKSGSRTYKVVEIKRQNHKYPVVAERLPDGKRFKFATATVEAGLVKVA